MATVWAYRNDAFSWKNDATKTGWSHAIKFGSISDLVAQLKDARPSLGGQITKLAIVAHGDTPGLVRLDRDLSAASASTFRQEFLQLRGFLGSYARLIFFSCIAGADVPGSMLLNALSGQLLPHCHVIGFEVFGNIGLGAAQRFAGEVVVEEHAPASPQKATPAGPNSNSPVITEYSWYAKWSLDGVIIRKSMNDQGRPTHVERRAIGLTMAKKAIRDHLPHVTAIYFENNRVRAKVPEAEYMAVVAKVNMSSHQAMAAMVGSGNHEGVIVTWTDYVNSYKCADPLCPGHSKPWHFCEAFVSRFPNGPLK